MRKSVKVILIILLLTASIFIGSTACFYIITAEAKLDKNKLINYGQSITICDDNGEEIENASVAGKRESVLLKDLNDNTVNAFIASEDRNFYRHNGLNYKRMIKALYKNVTTSSFKEGASTISQQLIKNTHLSNDKTIKRKLNEIRLTKQLEKNYSKDEILEMYLNTIYFGHNCYGLESAANFYFDKKASELNLEESATLVGLLTSPNNYSPFKHPEKSLKRRNVVLKNMLDCGFINDIVYEETTAKPLTVKSGSSGNKYSDYVSAVFDELDEIEQVSLSSLAGCRIYTYLNKNAQNFIESLEFPCDNSVIITSVANGGVSAYISSINGARRQPGSTVKPVLVYAPAIEEKIVHSFTKISDEKINYNGYSPENYDKKYHGEVTVAESISRSLNVPAVKTLNSLTIQKAEKYAKKAGINLENQEKNLSLALGGMKYGLNLKQICDDYKIFADGGNYSPSRFIKKITDAHGKIIYSVKNSPTRVFSQGTCSVINQALIETSKTGTAKKLKNFKFDVAAKTGTCGNEQGNTDAYAISYTSDACFGIWLGDKQNKKTDITGGGDCCNYMKELLNFYYKDKTPRQLETEKGTKTIYIDREEYDKKGKIVLAEEISPTLNKMKVKCTTDNVPTENSDKFSNPVIANPEISVNNNIVVIKLCQTEYYSYLIKRQENGKEKLIYDGKYAKEVRDEPQSSGSYIYTVTPYYSYNGKKYFGKTHKLRQVIISETNNNYSPPDIVYKDWYNQ